jgi:cyanophycinase
LKALAGHAGLYGVGIDEETALVVQGRRMTVVGSSYVMTCLPASTTKSTSIQAFKAGDVADLVAQSRSAIARTQPAFPPTQPCVPYVAKGTLIIGGGGALSEEIWKRFIQCAGGPDALIVVIPTALEDPVPADPSEARALRRAGAKNIKVLHTRNRTEADTAAFVEPLKTAGGIWFSGGRQWRFLDSYEGTAAEKAFHEVLERGGVIGGSSAGASIQSDYMPRGDPLGNLKIIAEGYERGFGFLPGVAIDQHFFQRKRFADMTELMAVYPQLLGIGIGEGTVLVVHGSVMEIVGKSPVAVYDRRRPVVDGQKDYDELVPGTRYDLAAQQRIEKK